MVNQKCFECLKRQIEADYSENLIFCYGLSDSHLPFGSTAVVQVENSSGEASPQFILKCLLLCENDCLAKYINEFYQEDCEGNLNNRSENVDSLVINQDEAAVGVGVPSGDSTSVETKTTESEKFPSGGEHTCLYGSGCRSLTCNFSGRVSFLRTITALAPIARIGSASYAIFKEFAADFLSGYAEDHVLCSLTSLIEGKAAGRDSINFLSLVGIPSPCQIAFPGCIRHPNIAPILGILKTSSQINLVLPKAPNTLQSILHYSPGALKSDWHMKFLVYQLLSGLAYMHDLGIAHGNVCPSNLMLTDYCWCWLPLSERSLSGFNSNLISEECHSHSRVDNCSEVCFSRGLFADSKISQSVDWNSSFYHWWKGELSNFEYLLILNRMAGRRWGDHTFYTVMPWVIDFSVKPDENSDEGWRDLSKSKWRLAKGDEQLDFTYSTSEIPHHVSDECLSELAVCSYKARRLPLSVLRMAVRSVYEPNEYPSTMQRLYQWTPDECIPEFYCDPRIFYSLHSGMSDLAVPSWAGTPEEFIKFHRYVLESNWVSHHIHHWIDITFGYQMSGQAAVAAKNVMLPQSAPTEPKSVGRHQLFTKPHPARRVAVLKSHERTKKLGDDHHQVNGAPGKESVLWETTHLNQMEEAAEFCERARHLSPRYNFPPNDYVKDDSSGKELSSEYSQDIGKYGKPLMIDTNYLLKCIGVDDETSLGYQELILWRQRSSRSNIFSEDVANDIFAFGCILAELYLKKPLFDPISFAAYLESGMLPGSTQELPPPTQILVEACIQKDWKRRPSAKCLLESPYFSRTVRSSYLFLAPLQLLAKDESRLRYAATFVKQGALRAMGAFAAEMCAPLCLPLVVNPSSDIEAEWAHIVLKEFLNCLNPVAVKKLLVPVIQKILQSAGHSHLKVSLLQGSFMQEIWCLVGKQAYLETIHPYVISNLYVTPHKSSASAASVLLIGSSEELGAPITIHQTILPIIHYFGKGLCGDGIDVVVRIGGSFGENFVVKQMLPLLQNVVRSCIDSSFSNKSEPSQSWSIVALMDCLLALDGLAASLPRETVVKELIEDKSCLYVQLLMQTNIGIPVLQVAAANLIAVCQRIGPDLTALHVLPKLKELFDELAFSQESNSSSGTSAGSLKSSRIKPDEGDHIESRRDLVFLLYPSFASLLGIEKLRQCCATWLLLEQFLLHHHNWKWEHMGESSRSNLENTNSGTLSFCKSTISDYTPAKMLLNGVGWSVPQSQGSRGAKNLISNRSLSNRPQVEKHVISSNFGIREPWYWFPSQAACWDGPDYIGRATSPKDELPWKIRASVLHSVRAHHGAIRSVAVCQDEHTVFTAGVGPGFKGTVQKWQLSTVDCLSGYHGHEEVVNDICVLTSSGRVASCDGTVHVWDGQTGKLISLFAEFPTNPMQHASPSASSSKMNTDQGNLLHYNSSSSGLLNTAFDESLYTTMHYLEFVDMLVVGNGSGSLRFIDVSQGRKLHLWRSGSIESSFPSLISSICSCSSGKVKPDGAASFPSWVAAGLSSGYCKLFDMRTGDIIASWQAHDGYVTKLAAPEEHLLVSSSLDKTLRVWDLRRSWTSPSMIFKGHNDGISSFSVWGKDVISISKNKIGLSSLARSADEDGQHRVTPQQLYTADRESKNMSVLSSISILPFSRLFLVGTEDGHLKICC